MFDPWADRAVNAGLRAGEEETLPITATSFGVRQAVSKDRSKTMLMVGACFVIIFLMMMNTAFDSLFFGEFNSESFQMLGAWMTLGLVVLLVMWRSMSQRSDTYVDPQIAIDVMESGIFVRGPAGSEEIGFAEAAFDVEATRIDGSTHFVGIALVSRQGPILLSDLGYTNGKRAAAAIAFKADQAGVRPRAVSGL